MRKLFKFIFVTVPLLAVLLIITVVVLNAVKFTIYEDYYLMEENICTNPGLNDGFVCQGICVSEDDERILVSGYMKNGENSRIYVTDYNSNSYYVSLQAGGKAFTGHAGGVAVTDGTVYLASGKKIYTLPFTEVFAAANGEVLDMSVEIELEHDASFVYTDERYLYVGEFFDTDSELERVFMTDNGAYPAVISRYPINDLTAPDKMYAVREQVQGVCFTPDGKVILSTSYGLADTVYYEYEEADAVLTEGAYNGLPVYALDNCLREIHGPAMGEDLDYLDGRVITLTESASDKYIFGKLFFATKIVALDFNK